MRKTMSAAVMSAIWLGAFGSVAAPPDTSSMPQLTLTPATPPDAESTEPQFSVNATAASDYIFRGVSQTENHSAVFNVSDGLDKLARQIRQTVDWAACMESCRAAGVSKIIELGPGGALAHLMRDEIAAGDIHSLAEFHSRAGVLQWIER